MGEGPVRVQAEPMGCGTRRAWGAEKRGEIGESIQVSHISSWAKGVFGEGDGLPSDEVCGGFYS